MFFVLFVNFRSEYFSSCTGRYKFYAEGVQSHNIDESSHKSTITSVLTISKFESFGFLD